MTRAYHRRRGWLSWHTALLGRIDDMPDLAELTGEPAAPESEADRAERSLRNSLAWAVVTGGDIGQTDAPKGAS